MTSTDSIRLDTDIKLEVAGEISDRARDYLNLDSLFTSEEIALRDRVREFVRRRIVPNIAGWYEKAVFPREITTEMGDLWRATAAPAGAPSTTAWRPWNSRPAIPASARSSVCRGHSR